jgi:hypothetical protein
VSRTDVSEERIAFIIRVARIGELQLPVTANVFSSPLIFYPDDGDDTFLRNVGSYKSTRRYIPEDGILHSYRRENLKSYIALTGWALWLRRNVSPVRYKLGFYIPEDGILHSHCRENLKSYIALEIFPAIARHLPKPRY